MSLPPPSTSLTDLYPSVNSKIDTLIVADLQKVCRIEGLPVSGKKAELQTRLKTRSKYYFDNRSEDNLRNFNDRLQNPNSMTSRQPFLFRPSPFYAFDRRLGQLHLPISKEHRNAATTTLSLTQQDITALQNNTNMRVLVYSAAKLTSALPGQLLDISFPQQLEIRVNDHEVKANTRGIKNKSGTTKPVDITPFLRKRADSTNKLTVTYALTDKVFTVYIWLSKKQTIEELKAEVVKKVIRKERTLGDIRAKADDTDIITTSTNMKLKDPVSFMRIQIPCRGSSCEHVGCFDLETYLSMQEQAPQWECPLCSKKAPFADLAVDEYVQEILHKTTSSDEQVTIDLEGKWSRETKSSSSMANGSGTSAYQDDDDSDDLVEISGPRPTVMTTIKAEAPNTPSSMATPSVTSDAPNRGQKRPSEVIDLTISDDDEPPHKRPNTNLRQSSIHSQVTHNATTNYPYASHSPLSFSLANNSNLRNGTGSPSFRSNSPFSLGTSQFRSAIATLPGVASPQHQTQNLNQNQIHSQGHSQNSQAQSWSSSSNYYLYQDEGV